LVTVVDDFEQVAPLLAGEWRDPPVAEDEEFDARQHLEEPGVASIAAREREGRSSRRR
jgi:hypothetical protein